MFFTAEYALRRAPLAQGRQPGRGGNLDQGEGAVSVKAVIFTTETRRPPFDAFTCSSRQARGRRDRQGRLRKTEKIINLDKGTIPVNTTRAFDLILRAAFCVLWENWGRTSDSQVKLIQNSRIPLRTSAYSAVCHLLIFYCVLRPACCVLAFSDYRLPITGFFLPLFYPFPNCLPRPVSGGDNLVAACVLAGEEGREPCYAHAAGGVKSIHNA